MAYDSASPGRPRLYVFFGNLGLTAYGRIGYSDLRAVRGYRVMVWYRNEQLGTAIRGPVCLILGEVTVIKWTKTKAGYKSDVGYTIRRPGVFAETCYTLVCDGVVTKHGTLKAAKNYAEGDLRYAIRPN